MDVDASEPTPVPIDQVTPELVESLATVAVKFWVVPRATVAEVWLRETAMAGATAVPMRPIV